MITCETCGAYAENYTGRPDGSTAFFCDDHIAAATRPTFAEDVQREIARARAKHPPIHSLHEGYAVLLEEVDEFKAEVWKQTGKRDPATIRAELVQIAAMAQRIAEDCGVTP